MSDFGIKGTASGWRLVRGKVVSKPYSIKYELGLREIDPMFVTHHAINAQVDIIDRSEA